MQSTHNNFLANYEIVIRLHDAHTNIVTLRKTWSQLYSGPVRKDARSSRKALLQPCVSGNEQNRHSNTRALGFYAKLCKSCIRVSWVTERRAFENDSDCYKHDAKIRIKMWKMYFPGTDGAPSPCDQITTIFALCQENEMFCNF